MIIRLDTTRIILRKQKNLAPHWKRANFGFSAEDTNCDETVLTYVFPGPAWTRRTSCTGSPSSWCACCTWRSRCYDPWACSPSWGCYYFLLKQAINWISNIALWHFSQLFTSFHIVAMPLPIIWTLLKSSFHSKASHFPIISHISRVEILIFPLCLKYFKHNLASSTCMACLHTEFLDS